MSAETRFYHYSQNNNGGTFDYDADRGITHHVVIEAVDAAHADARAEQIGLYWNGCESGRDCSCCGDRWSPAWDSGDAEPMVYDMPVATATSFMTWMEKGREIALHRLGAEPEWFGMAKKRLGR